jgi:hypothetical protein
LLFRDLRAIHSLTWLLLPKFALFSFMVRESLSSLSHRRNGEQVRPFASPHETASSAMQSSIIINLQCESKSSKRATAAMAAES